MDIRDKLKPVLCLAEIREPFPETGLPRFTDAGGDCGGQIVIDIRMSL
jgi:hypothetical protein